MTARQANSPWCEVASRLLANISVAEGDNRLLEALISFHEGILMSPDPTGYALRTAAAVCVAGGRFPALWNELVDLAEDPRLPGPPVAERIKARVAIVADSSMIPHRRKKDSEAQFEFDPAEYLVTAAKGGVPTPGTPRWVEPAHQLEAKTWAVGCGTSVDLRLQMEEEKRWLDERDDCQKVMLLSWCGNDFCRKT